MLIPDVRVFEFHPEPVHGHVGTDKTVPYREFPGQTFRPRSKKKTDSVPGVPVVPGAVYFLEAKGVTRLEASINSQH